MWPFKRRHSDIASTGQSEQHVLSITLPEEVASLGGLPSEAVAAVVQATSLMEGGEIPVESVRPNPLFIDFMHHVVRTYGPLDTEMRAAATQQGDGWLYVIDLRTPEGPQGNVPGEDVIGGFKVESGEIDSSSYRPNDKHAVFTANGLVQLPPSLRAAFVEELKRRASAAPREPQD